MRRAHAGIDEGGAIEPLLRAARGGLGAVLAVVAGCGGAPLGPAVPVAGKGPVPEAAPVAAVSSVLPRGTWLARYEHVHPVRCVAFSADGRKLVTGSRDGVLVWDPGSGAVLRRFEGENVEACAFLPDGQRVATGDAHGTALGDVGSGALVRLYPQPSTSALAVRPDGGEVLIGTEGGHVMAWDPRTGKPVFGQENPLHIEEPDRRIGTVGYTDDGARFAFAWRSGRGMVWHGDKGAKLGDVRVEVGTAASLPGGRWLLGGLNDLVLVEPGKPPLDLYDHEGALRAFAWDARRGLVLTGNAGGLAVVRGLRPGPPACKVPGEGTIAAVAVSPAGDRFAIAREDGTITIASAEDCTVQRRLGVRRVAVTAIAAGASVLLGDASGRVSEWSADGLTLRRSAVVHTGDVVGLSLLPDGRWASLGQAGSIAVAQVALTSPSGSLRLQFPRDYAHGRVAAAPDGDVLIATQDGLRLWPGAGGLPVDVVRGFLGSEPGLALRPQGDEAVVEEGGHIHRIRVRAQNVISRWKGYAQALAYAPDGRLVAVAHAWDVELRNAETGALVRTLGRASVPAAVAVTQTHVWAGGMDGKIRRWPLAGGHVGAFDAVEPDLEVAAPHDLQALAVTADGRLLVASFEDGRALVYGLPGGEPAAELVILRDGSWATIRADGRFAASAGEALGLSVEDPTTHTPVTLGNLVGRAPAAALPVP